jgi:hypothetical protein
MNLLSCMLMTIFSWAVVRPTMAFSWLPGVTCHSSFFDPHSDIYDSWCVPKCLVVVILSGWESCLGDSTVLFAGDGPIYAVVPRWKLSFFPFLLSIRRISVPCAPFRCLLFGSNRFLVPSFYRSRIMSSLVESLCRCGTCRHFKNVMVKGVPNLKPLRKTMGCAVAMKVPGGLKVEWDPIAWPPNGNLFTWK